MDALLLVLASGAALLLAYFTYGRWLSKRIFQLDDARPTPAVTEADGTDYVPTRKSIIFGHHFTSIAGTGPIVGPAIAVMWGWLPAILWVILGSIFVGAVHDLGSIVVSLRNKGRSIGDVAGDLLGPRARLVFLAILIVGLWIVLAVFGLVIAAVLRQYPAAVFPVVVQIPLAIAIGVLVHRRGGQILWPSVISLALMYASVVWGDWGPLHAFNHTLAAQPLWLWTIGLLVYCYVASVLPVWVLLQPRDYINALQLISALALIVAGLIAAATLGGPADQLASNKSETTENTKITEGGMSQGIGKDPSSSSPTPSSSSVSSVPSVVSSSPERPRLEIVAPMIDWQPTGAPPMLPVLFITIACGACSGFHCLVGSGTTSKQLSREGDARAVGYGSMLTEGFLATLVIAACCAGIGLSTKEAWFLNADIYDFLEQHGAPAFSLHGDVLQSGYIPGAGGFVEDPVHVEINADGKVRLIPADANTPSPAWTEVGGGAYRIREHYWGSGIDSDLVDLRGKLVFAKQYESWSAAGSLAAKVGAFVEGAANFVASLGIPLKIAIALIGVMVASFAGTTMDTACRLQRYVVQELSRTFLPRVGHRPCASCGYDLTGIDPLRAVTHDDVEEEPHGEGPEGGYVCPECGHVHETVPDEIEGRIEASWHAASPTNPFKWLATTHGATLFAVATALALAFIPPPGTAWTLDQAGKGGLILWPLFGATNQLLAGFAFVVITAWLIVTRRPWWFAILPGVFMLAVPASAMAWQSFIGNADNPSWLAAHNWLLVAIASVTLALEAWLLIEVGVRWMGKGPRDRGIMGSRQGE